MSARVTAGGVLLGLFSLVTLASAQSSGLVLDMKNGLVTLDARDVPVTQILNRWAQIAGVTVVNGDKLASVRVTMRLDGVTQREALALLLRDAGGYIAASRPSPSGRGTEIDRILIVPRSAQTPAPTPSTQRAASGRASRAPENAGSGSAQTTAALESTLSPGSDADTSADDAQAAERNPEPARDGRQPRTPTATVGGTSQPLVNGLTLDEIRARGVRTAADPIDPPVDPSRYAARQAEQAQRAQQAQQEAAEAARTGPFGARGTAAQPGTVAPQPRTGPNAPAQPPTSQP